MNNQLIVIALLLCFISKVQAQQESLKAFKESLFDINCNSLDTSASAFVLEEYGHTAFQEKGNEGDIHLIHHYSVRIKILKSEGFDQANFSIPLYKIGNKFEIIEAIRGKTYNLVNGKVEVTDLEKSQIFTEKSTNYVQLSKFTLPNLKEGSIIELRYRIVSESLFNFRQWQFQSNIPKLSSVFVSEIPKNFIYNTSLKGNITLSSRDVSTKPNCFQYLDERKDCIKTTYVMQNIPAFIEENYMLSAKNYISTLNFELQELRNDNGMVLKKFTRDWKDVENIFKQERDFGGQLKNSSHFKKILPEILVDKSTDLLKAKAIYSYIQNQIKWNTYVGCFTEKGVEESIKTRTGNSADINLALINCLNTAGLAASPVILSTRSNAIANLFYPAISDYNYVIASLRIDSTDYLLDATDIYNPFGELPLRAINHSGRIIYASKPSESILIENKSISMYQSEFDGELLETGELKGKLIFRYGGLQATNKRHEIAEINDDMAYLEQLENKIYNLKIDSISIHNLKDVNNLLTIKLSITYKVGSDQSQNEFIFNPTLFDRIEKNPFNLDQRTYPIDMGSKISIMHYANIKLPAGYSIKDKPKAVSMSLPERSARYAFKINEADSKITIEQAVNFNKSIYLEDQYLDLKEFYSRIIQHQKLEMSIAKNL